MRKLEPRRLLIRCLFVLAQEGRMQHQSIQETDAVYMSDEGCMYGGRAHRGDYMCGGVEIGPATSMGMGWDCHVY